jgi:phosphoglycolate phosphatase-like HAD superfamily hydrolase
MDTRAFKGLVELTPGFAPRPSISHVLFDFDGTLSLLREGWPAVMAGMFLEFLPPHPGETVAQRRAQCFDDIMRLNGKQTIYQMIQLAERVRDRGGQPQEPLAYKHEYLRRLEATIGSRKDSVRTGTVAPDTFLVAGSRTLLDLLRQRGLHLYLASGTDEPLVKEEAALLQVADYFGPHIYGAVDDYKKFSKKMVIERILRENQIDGSQLLAFGDGYVEIQNTVEAGGLAVAVASDEANNGSSRFDPWKHQRLLGVGAQLVVPDFRDAHALIDLLLTQP